MFCFILRLAAALIKLSDPQAKTWGEKYSLKVSQRVADCISDPYGYFVCHTQYKLYHVISFLPQQNEMI